VAESARHLAHGIGVVGRIPRGPTPRQTLHLPHSSLLAGGSFLERANLSSAPPPSRMNVTNGGEESLSDLLAGVSEDLAKFNIKPQRAVTILATTSQPVSTEAKGLVDTLDKVPVSPKITPRVLNPSTIRLYVPGVLTRS